MKYIGIIFLSLVGTLAFIWILQCSDFFLYKTFAPKYEAVRRQTFEQSKAYNQGMVQELQNMQFQFIQADKEHKAALASVILHRAADYDESAMPPALAEFVRGLRQSAGSYR
jgi:hypothetical protein